MEISGSILGIRNNHKKISEMINSGINFLHLDVMDGIFVSNFSLPYDECLQIPATIPLDVHLMVSNPKIYIEKFINIKPKYITFHVETDNISDNINLIRQNNILVGLAINPETNMSKILPYLTQIDLALVMSVKPGYGGQTFIEESINKIEQLKDYRKNNNLNFKIEVDGGITVNNLSLIKTDIVVIGTAITSTDNYRDTVNKIGERL